MSSPFTEFSFLADIFLEDFVVPLQESVMLNVELLQLSRAALEALLALRQSDPQLLYLRGQLLSERDTKRPNNHNEDDTYSFFFCYSLAFCITVKLL